MIKIMVDSSSDCAKESGVYDFFIPITVNINDNEYRDGLELDSDTFYAMLLKSEEVPHTSQPSPETFLEIFEQVKESGDELIYFALSSELSGTYQSANIAKTMVDYEGIYIIDSRGATHMIAYLARYARKLINDGMSLNTILDLCEKLKKRIKVFAGVDTLEYLKKGGRIGNAAALLGTIANIKPLITVSEEGQVEAAGKALGFGKAIQAITEKVKTFDIDPKFPISSLYTFGEENCIKLEQKLNDVGYKVDSRLQVGSTIGTHVGPGVYGVIFVTKQ